MKRGKTRRSMRRFYRYNWEYGTKRPLKAQKLVYFYSGTHRGTLWPWLIQESQLRWWNYPSIRGEYKPGYGPSVR